MDNLIEEPKTQSTTANKPQANKPNLFSEVETQAFKEFTFAKKFLLSLAKKYKITRVEYIKKFFAFRLYIDNKQVDIISVNDIALNTMTKFKTRKVKQQLCKGIIDIRRER